MATPATDPDGAKPSLLQRYLPILGWLLSYQRKWLAADAVAGLSVWALLVPQSLAYAALVGVPVQYGLYAAFAALIAYPLFGTSRQLVEGPSATVGAVSFAVVAPLVGAAAMGTSAAVGYTAALALATGALYVAHRNPAHAGPAGRTGPALTLSLGHVRVADDHCPTALRRQAGHAPA